MTFTRTPISPAEWAAIEARQRAEAERMRSYYDQATPDTASRLGEWQERAPWMPADALSALVLAGASDATIEQAAKTSAEQRMAKGAEIERPTHRPDPWWHSGPYDWLKGATRVTTTVLSAPIEGLTTAASNLSEASRNLDPTGISDALERRGMMEPQAGKQSTFRDVARLVTLGVVDPAQPFDAARSTTAGQAIEGMLSDEPVDLGSGFFPGGWTAQHTVAEQRKLRGTVNGHAWTVGRYSGTLVAEPGTRPYNTLSGVIDLAWTLGVDPTNYVGAAVGKASRAADVATAATKGDPALAAARIALADADKAEAAGDLAKAAALRSAVPAFADQAQQAAGITRAARKADPVWRSQVAAAAGLIEDSPRKTVYTPAALRWLYSPEGNRVAVWLANERSANRIWWALDRKADPRIAGELADTRTVEDVIGVLGRHFSDGSLRETPTAGRWSGEVGRFGMRMVNRAEDKHRLLNQMPQGTYLDPDDPLTAVRNLNNALANINLLGADRDKLVDRFIQALNADDATRSGVMKSTLDALSDAVADHLRQHGLDKLSADRNHDVAWSVTRWSGRSYDKWRRYMIDSVGHGIPLDDIGLPGQFGPHRVSELLDSGGFLYDPKALRSLRTMTARWQPWQKLLGDVKIETRGGIAQPGTIRRAAVYAPVTAMDWFQTRIWKPLVMMRPAYLTRVLPEEAMRVMMGGAFDHPADYIMTVLGHGYGTDVLGHNFADARKAYTLVRRAEKAAARGHTGKADALFGEAEALLGKDMEKYRDGLAGAVRGHNTGYAGDVAIADRMVRRGDYQIATRAEHPAQWVEGVSEELIHLANDPVARRVANGGLLPGDGLSGGTIAGRGGMLAYNPQTTPNSLDLVVQWLMNGAGNRYRRSIQAAYPKADFDDVNVVRAWVDRYAEDIGRWTGNEADLRQAIVDGEIGGASLGTLDNLTGRRHVSKELRDRVREWRDQPGTTAPEVARYEVRLDPQGPASQVRSLRDDVVSWFFTDLYGKNSDYLARSPEFRRAYWQRVEELAGQLSPAEARRLLTRAKTAGAANYDRILARARTASGEGTLEGLDDLAKGYALDDVKKLLYDASNRSQFFDVWRVVFPFGEAWKEILSTWMRLTTKNPTIVYQAKKAVTGARGAGWFHSDANGEEVFTYPGSQAMFAALGISGEMTGSVKGMSVAGSVLPGVGPAVSYYAGSLLADKPQFDEVTKMLFPYGVPDSPMGTVVPAWAQKMAYGPTGNVPVVSGTLDRVQQLLRTGDSDRMYADTVNQVLKAKAESGEYDLADEADRDRLLTDSKNAARWLFAFRGFIQATGPSAPRSEIKVQDTVTQALVDDFREMQADPEIGYDGAAAAFLDKWGDYAVYYMVATTRSNVGGLQATDAFSDWERTNPGLFEDYPASAGFFGPAGKEDEFDIAVYSRQLKQGRRSKITAEETVSEGNEILGRMLYERAKDQLPESEADYTDEQRQWLASYRQQLMDTFPGFDPQGAVAMSRTQRTKRIDELRAAVNDPRLEDNVNAQSIALYLSAREQAQQEAMRRGYRSWTQAKATADLRDWLRSYADALVAANPGFDRVWTQVFRGEMADDGGS